MEKLDTDKIYFSGVIFQVLKTVLLRIKRWKSLTYLPLRFNKI